MCIRSIESVYGAGDSRFARQSDGGGRGHAARRRDRAAAVPSGASTGAHEAVELRDGDKKRYGGKGVLKAVGNVNERSCRSGRRARRVRPVARRPRRCASSTARANKGRLGANAILGVSLAVARAAAEAVGSAALPLPRRAERADAAGADDEHPQRRQARRGSSVDMQEFMVDAGRRADVRGGSALGHRGLSRPEEASCKARGCNTNVGDEGGYAPSLASNEEALDVDRCRRSSRPATSRATTS